MNSPILLIRKNSIPQETIDEIKGLEQKNALLVGGENVILVTYIMNLKLKDKNIQRIAE